MLHLKNILSPMSSLLVLVQLFYHNGHRPFLYIQADKYNSWFVEARYCELHILHYSHMVELLYKDSDIHDQYMLVC